MLGDVSIDLGTVVLLAVVVWLDGWRRRPNDALLVTRSGLGPWTVRPPWTRAGPLALVALWEPIVVPVLLSPTAAHTEVAAAPWARDYSVALARTRRRLRRVRLVVVALRAFGILMILWIILGIPVATGRFGAEGLLYGVLAAFVLAIELTFVTTVALRRFGIPFRRAFRMTAPLLSPFTTPRAASIVTTAAVGPLDSVVPLVALLGESAFLAWIRPYAFDELAGRTHAPENETIVNLVRTLPRRTLERAVEPAVDHALNDDAARYCPRCTRTYRDVMETCDHCSELALVAVRGRGAT